MDKTQILNALYELKKERDYLLSSNYITRTIETKNSNFFESSLIKVIVGPRRAGKSRLAISLLYSASKKDKNPDFIYINFDDLVLRKIKDDELLISCFKTVYGENIKNILLDEVQNVVDWELLVNKLQRRGYQILVTGSNAKVLSQELTTHLTGRIIEIELFPFSYKELKDITNLEKQLTFGGFPDIILNNQDQFYSSNYLKQLVEAIIYKDIVARFKIRQPLELLNAIYILIDNITSKTNYKKLAELFKVKSDLTAKKYVSYLEQTYLVQVLSNYSKKPKNRDSYIKKIYLIDNGILNLLQLKRSPNLGKSLENYVFTELRKKGAVPYRNLFFYITQSGYEIDFVFFIDNNSPTLIQVSWDIDAFETEKREVRALIEAAKELNSKDLLIITRDQNKIIYKDSLRITVISIEEYLKQTPLE